MYKKQMVFQKVVCLIALICGSLIFIYSLGIMTDLYDCLYSTIADANNLEQTYVTGSRIYYDMQGFNKTLLTYGIVLVVCACLLFVFQTSSRRRYYLGNYVTTGLFVAADLFVVFSCHPQIEMFKAQWLQINFDELKMFSDMFKTAYTESTFWFDVHYYIFALCVVEAVLLIANVIWKLSLMKQEKALIGTKGEAV